MPNEDVKEEVIEMLNRALEMEHQANIQYLSHAELVDGLNSEPIIDRIKEIAKDEHEHAEKLRTLIGDYLDGAPSMKIAQTKEAHNIREILLTNLGDEKEAVNYYKEILRKVNQLKDSLPYNYLKIEHDVRHIVMDEQEHIAELRKLLAMKISEVEEE